MNFQTDFIPEITCLHCKIVNLTDLKIINSRDFTISEDPQITIKDA